MNSYVEEVFPRWSFTNIVGYYRFSVPVDTVDGPAHAGLVLPFGEVQGVPGTPNPDPYVQPTTSGDLDMIEVIKNGIESQLGVTVTVTKVTLDMPEETVSF